MSNDAAMSIKHIENLIADDRIAYSINAAVAVCGGALSRTMLYRAAQLGDIKMRKIEKRSFIMRDELIAYLKSRPTAENNSARVNLSAAAPDLLAALIELSQWAEQQEMPEGTFEIVRLAIAKAEGK